MLEHESVWVLMHDNKFKGIAHLGVFDGLHDIKAFILKQLESSSHTFVKKPCLRCPHPETTTCMDFCQNLSLIEQRIDADTYSYTHKAFFGRLLATRYVINNTNKNIDFR